tara:strand:+ start:265 stop:519 length:255 start_codon:yes stop_codon:yes gene_type:complete
MEKLKITSNCNKRSYLERLFSIDSMHEWQSRAKNRYGLPTYEVCLKCGRARERNCDRDAKQFSECERIKEFDDQFDKKGNYIYE